MTERLFLTGGQFRPGAAKLGEGRPYQEAQLVSLDLATGRFDKLISLSGGGPHYPAEHPNQLFTAATLDGDILWLPSETEIFKYSLPDLTLLDCFSHRCFNNIHSICVHGDDLVVTSTGLDNVVFLSRQDGQIKRVVNAEGKDPWHRFSPEHDYRIEVSTRPHDAHPNFVFSLDDKLWVTRCALEDAVCLEDTTQRIDLTQGEDISVHDGLSYGDQLVFTRVDGKLIFCGKKSKHIEHIVDPFANGLGRPLGWCRGLHIKGDTFYIGYSRIRPTKTKRRLKYLMSGNFKYAKGHTALVVAFNLRERKVERVYEAPPGIVDAIYGILPAPDTV